MNVILYRYGSICEPDVKEAFRRLKMDVVEIDEEITRKDMPASRRVELVSDSIQKNAPAFVFSINFFPAIAEVCHIFGILYLCWTVDSPVPELFSKSIRYETNRVFLFDRAQYQYFHPFCPDGIFHLPLASGVERFDKTLQEMKDVQGGEETEIVFVGSLYSEKNPLKKIKLSEYTTGYIDGIAEASLKVYGYNLMEQSLSEAVVEEIKEKVSDFISIKDAVPQVTEKEMDRYMAAHAYIGYAVAEKERIRTLNLLAEHFRVDLYTRSDTGPLKNVHVHGGVKTLTEMPFLFHRAKINLNMTIKPIQTGLPLRIFDIMGCGGFLMTNIQEELSGLFDIGVDLEAYGSMEELIDKCGYYLQHEEERNRIARNGYEKVKRFDTYEMRIAEMLKTFLGGKT